MPRVTITVPNKTPQPYRFPLERESVSLGRGSDNDIAIDCGSVSVKHAEMRRIRGGYELRDMGSTNGIKLDGEKQPVIALRNGISATLGDVAFDFLLTDEELAALSAERLTEPEAPPQPAADRDSNARPPKAPAPAPAAQASGGGVGMTLLFLILAAAAFVAGMAVRFQKETGGSLIDAIRAKQQKVVTPAAQPGK